MTIVDATPYYLVTDVAGNPYFQPLYQDVSTGLDVFKNFATNVTVSIGARSGADNTVVITNMKTPGGGHFVIDPNSLRIVASTSAPGGSAVILIEPLSYTDPNLIATGYQYVLDKGVKFLITTNWSSTPNTQSIGSVSQQPPVNSFYIYPVEGLIDSQGKPASISVFSAIYDDVVGRTPETFLFTSHAAWEAGAGQPYYYCADSSCGPLCFGTCGGRYSGCQRLKDNNFACRISVSTTCKVLALLPFMIPTILCMIAFMIIFFRSKRINVRATEGGTIHDIHYRHVFTTGIKVALSVLIAIPALLLITMIILASVDTQGSSWYLRSVCRLSGDYQ